MKTKVSLFIFCISTFFIANCGTIKVIAMKAVAPILRDDVIVSVFAEGDYELVKSGLPANLILLQGLLHVSPKNFDLLVMNAEGFCGYAIGFVEDDDPKRATLLYSRAKEYGMQALKQHRKFRKAVESGIPVREAIKLIKDKDYLPALLWTGLSWGLNIVLNVSDPMLMVQAPEVVAIMKQIIIIDDKYYYGLPYVFFGSYYSILPSIFGGGKEKVEAEFKKCFDISKGKLLLADVFYARFYATLILDEALFEQKLKNVLETPSNVIPDVLLNEIAKAKAKRLIKDKNKYF